MPALGIPAGGAFLGALAPIVPLADVPSVQFNDQGERLFGQRQHLFGALAGAHLFVQLGALALAAGFPIQGGRRQFHSGQSFHHGAGFLNRHFADG